MHKIYQWCVPSGLLHIYQWCVPSGLLHIYQWCVPSGLLHIYQWCVPSGLLHIYIQTNVGQYTNQCAHTHTQVCRLVEGQQLELIITCEHIKLFLSAIVV